MILYSDVMKHRNKIGKFFSETKRNPRTWDLYQSSGNVLSFGSGNVNDPNYQEIKNIFVNTFSCDSDTSSGADYKNLDEIEKTKKFDLIICEHVLEHVKIEDFINDLAEKLYNVGADDSKLVVTLPNIYNVGGFFCNFDHKNFAPPIDIAAILCCVGFELIDVYKWSKIHHMVQHFSMNEIEKFLENFLEKNYGLEVDRYVTMVFQKNG